MERIKGRGGRTVKRGGQCEKKRESMEELRRGSRRSMTKEGRGEKMEQ